MDIAGGAGVRHLRLGVRDMSYGAAQAPLRAQPLISTLSLFSVGPMARNAGLTPASTAWATGNQARYVPFLIPDQITIVKLLAYNGSTANGNTDIGLYDEGGNQIVGIAAAAQSGTTAWQEFDIADTTINPGLYYIGLLNSGTTGTYFAYADLQWGRILGVYSQAVGAGNLPNPATFAALDAFGIPIVAMSQRSTI